MRSLRQRVAHHLTLFTLPKIQIQQKSKSTLYVRVRVRSPDDSWVGPLEASYVLILNLCFRSASFVACFASIACVGTIARRWLQWASWSKASIGAVPRGDVATASSASSS